MVLPDETLYAAFLQGGCPNFTCSHRSESSWLCTVDDTALISFRLLPSPSTQSCSLTLTVSAFALCSLCLVVLTLASSLDRLGLNRLPPEHDDDGVPKPALHWASPANSTRTAARVTRAVLAAVSLTNDAQPLDDELVAKNGTNACTTSELASASP